MPSLTSPPVLAASFAEGSAIVRKSDYNPISPGAVNTKALPPEFRKSRSELVGIEGSFEGYTKGDHWSKNRRRWQAVSPPEPSAFFGLR